VDGPRADTRRGARRPHLLGPGDIHLHRQRAATQRSDLVRGAVAVRDVAQPERDVCTRFGEGDRDRAAEAPRRAGDERGPSGQVEPWRGHDVASIYAARGPLPAGIAWPQPAVTTATAVARIASLGGPSALAVAYKRLIGAPPIRRQSGVAVQLRHSFMPYNWYEARPEPIC